MFLTRVFGRAILGAAAKSEFSIAAAAAYSTAARNPLEEFFKADRKLDDDKPVVNGRSWKAAELRLKSWPRGMTLISSGMFSSKKRTC